MPRYVYRGGRGVRATYRRRLRRPTERGCTCAPAFLSYNSRARGTKSHISTPLDMFRFRPFFKIRFTHSIVGNIRRQGRCRSARAFRRTTFFTNFHLFPRTGQCAFPSGVLAIGNSGQSAFPVRFFLLHRIGRPRLSALRGNARRSSKRTGTSPKTARRRIPLPTIRNHTIYSLSGTAVCGAMGIDERPAAKGLVKLARPCVALNCGSAVPFILDSSF